MNRISRACFVIATFATTPCFAELSDGLREDVIRLSGFHTLYEAYVSGCEAAESAASIARIAAGAARPQSPAPEVNENKETRKACSDPDEKQVLKALASLVGTDLQPNELEQMKAFLATPAGPHFLRLHREAIDKGFDVYQNLHHDLPISR